MTDPIGDRLARLEVDHAHTRSGVEALAVECAQLRAIVDELRSALRPNVQRAAHLRRALPADVLAPLAAALAATFAEGEPITVAVVSRWARDDPHGRIARALAGVVDVDAADGPEQLGDVLAALDCLEPNGRLRGARRYRLRGER